MMSQNNRGITSNSKMIVSIQAVSTIFAAFGSNLLATLLDAYVFVGILSILFLVVLIPLAIFMQIQSMIDV